MEREEKLFDCEQMNAEVWERIESLGFPGWETVYYETRDKATGEKGCIVCYCEQGWDDIFRFIHCYGLGKWGHVRDTEHRPFSAVLFDDIKQEAKTHQWDKERNPGLTQEDWTRIESAAQQVIYKWSASGIRRARELEDYIRNRDAAAAESAVCGR